MILIHLKSKVMQGFISRQHETHGSTAPSKQICHVREFLAIDKLCEQFRSKLINNVSFSDKTFRTLHPKWPYQISKYLDLCHGAMCWIVNLWHADSLTPRSAPEKILAHHLEGAWKLWLRGVSVVSLGIPWCCHERRALFQGTGGRNCWIDLWRCWTS